MVAWLISGPCAIAGDAAGFFFVPSATGLCLVAMYPRGFTPGCQALPGGQAIRALGHAAGKYPFRCDEQRALPLLRDLGRRWCTSPPWGALAASGGPGAR